MKKDGSVYYPTLEAKLAENGITKKSIRLLIAVNHATFCNKLNGKNDFLLQEAIKIQETYFPDISVNELFRY